MTVVEVQYHKLRHMRLPDILAQRGWLHDIAYLLYWSLSDTKNDTTNTSQNKVGLARHTPAAAREIIILVAQSKFILAIRTCLPLARKTTHTRVFEHRYCELQQVQRSILPYLIAHAPTCPSCKQKVGLKPHAIPGLPPP